MAGRRKSEDVSAMDGVGGALEEGAPDRVRRGKSEESDAGGLTGSHRVTIRLFDWLEKMQCAR
jgi:hypothetical protein